MRNGHHFILSHHQNREEHSKTKKQSKVVLCATVGHFIAFRSFLALFAPTSVRRLVWLVAAAAATFAFFLWIGFFFCLPISNTCNYLYAQRMFFPPIRLFVCSPTLFIYHIHSVRPLEAPYSISKQSLVMAVARSQNAKYHLLFDVSDKIFAPLPQ